MMIFLLLILCLALIIFTIIAISLLWTTVIGGVPYLATNRKRVEDMVSLANIHKGEKAAELGSGDGRIVIALAKKGAIVHGYELNLFYVLVSRWNIYRAGLQGKAYIHWKNFWHVDLSGFDIVTAYCISYLMGKLEKKLQKELKPNTRVVATSYRFKNWKYTKRKDFAFLYKKK